MVQIKIWNIYVQLTIILSLAFNAQSSESCVKTGFPINLEGPIDDTFLLSFDIYASTVDLSEAYLMSGYTNDSVMNNVIPKSMIPFIAVFEDGNILRWIGFYDLNRQSFSNAIFFNSGSKIAAVNNENNMHLLIVDAMTGVKLKQFEDTNEIFLPVEYQQIAEKNGVLVFSLQTTRDQYTVLLLNTTDYMFYYSRLLKSSGRATSIAFEKDATQKFYAGGFIQLSSGTQYAIITIYDFQANVKKKIDLLQIEDDLISYNSTSVKNMLVLPKTFQTNIMPIDTIMGSIQRQSYENGNYNIELFLFQVTYNVQDNTVIGENSFVKAIQTINSLVDIILIIYKEDKLFLVAFDQQDDIQVITVDSNYSVSVIVFSFQITLDSKYTLAKYSQKYGYLVGATSRFMQFKSYKYTTNNSFPFITSIEQDYRCNQASYQTGFLQLIDVQGMLSIADQNQEHVQGLEVLTTSTIAYGFLTDPKLVSLSCDGLENYYDILPNSLEGKVISV
eukprot:403373029